LFEIFLSQIPLEIQRVLLFGSKLGFGRILDLPYGAICR